MLRLEVSAAVRHIYMSLGFKRLKRSQISFYLSLTQRMYLDAFCKHGKHRKRGKVCGTALT